MGELVCDSGVDGKKCAKCERFLPRGAFNLSGKARDGLMSQCRECRGAVRAEKYGPNPTRCCTKCLKDLPATPEFFQRHRKMLHGVTAVCKECSNRVERDRRKNDPEFRDRKRAGDRARNERRKPWREAYRPILNARLKARRSADPSWAKSRYAAHRKWIKKNLPQAAAYARDYRRTHAGRINERSRVRTIIDPAFRDRRRARSRDWWRRNQSHILAYRKKNRARDRENFKNWLKKNPVKAAETRRRIYLRNPLRRSMSTRVAESLRRNGSGKNGASTEKLLGYTIATLRSHIERQFTGLMSWSNYGSIWHVDHIVPLAAFRIKSPDDDEFRAAWALTNLRPLTKHENQTKSSKREYLL